MQKKSKIIVEKLSKSVVNEQKLKDYNKPGFAKLGPMQRVTLGGTPGVGDSGQIDQNPPQP